MFRPFFIFIGQRYARIKRKNQFISFISLTSMMGIALGVAVLIIVLSVMNGFSREIRAQILSGAPHITLRGVEGNLENGSELQHQLKFNPHILGTSPFILGQAMLSQSGQARGVYVKGIDPHGVKQVFDLNAHMIQGGLSALVPGQYGIILGRSLAMSLGVALGDKITILVPEAAVSPAGITPRIKRFTIVGFFEIGSWFDVGQVFIHLQDADKLFRMHGLVSGLQLKIEQELDAHVIAQEVMQQVGAAYYASDWTQEFGNFFQVLKMEKMVTLFILLLIIAVAGFNLVSGLVMMVTDKRSDIAILRTLGATAKHIMGIFIAQGLMIGSMGILLGVSFGLIVAYYITPWVDFLEHTFNIDLIAKNVYAVNFLPSEIHTHDVLQVVILTFGICMVATIYPAWRAAHIQPAEALRYE